MILLCIQEVSKLNTFQVNLLLSLKVFLILENEKIRDLSNMNLFVELDDDTRFIRRMLRDMSERGRSLRKYHFYNTKKQLKPMFHKYIKPTKDLQDVIHSK